MPRPRIRGAPEKVRSDRFPCAEGQGGAPHQLASPEPCLLFHQSVGLKGEAWAWACLSPGSMPPGLPPPCTHLQGLHLAGAAGSSSSFKVSGMSSWAGKDGAQTPPPPPPPPKGRGQRGFRLSEAR